MTQMPRSRHNRVPVLVTVEKLIVAIEVQEFGAGRASLRLDSGGAPGEGAHLPVPIRGTRGRRI
jgi:hypothetical protein